MTITVDKKNNYLYQYHHTAWLAINHHKTHRNKPLTLVKHYYLRDILFDKSDIIAIMKSTQCGVSEFLIVYSIDAAEEGRSIFYVLPTEQLMRRFVVNRFDKSISFSPYYRDLIKSSAERKMIESVTLKDIGNGVIAFVGSNTPNPFTEFPADTIVIDEKDRCNQSHLYMAEERLSHSEHKKQIYVSNPTVEDFGIHIDFKDSDMKEWMIRCSNCGKFIKPDFFTHVVRQVDNNWMILDDEWDRNSIGDVNMICEYCNKPFDRFADGEWIQNRQHPKSGYHISKLFSGNVTVAEIVARFEKGLANPSIMERFYNGDLGLPYSASGAKITRNMIIECISDYLLDPIHGNPQDVNVGDMVLMGVDVQSKDMNVIIAKMLEDRRLKLLFIGVVNEYDDLKKLYKLFKVRVGVIDAQPEKRMARRVVATLKGFFQCYYSQIKRDIIDATFRMITVDRTQALDSVMEHVLLKEVLLPKNILNITNYVEQMCSSTRVYNEERQLYDWVETHADHYMHAECYLLLAKKLMLMLLGRRQSANEEQK